MRHSTYIDQSIKEKRHKSNRYGILLMIRPYLRPYLGAIFLALIALFVAAGTVLVLGQGLKFLVDSGFNAGGVDVLNTALFLLLCVVMLLAIATYARFYIVSWIGERVVADIRQSVFDRVIKLSPEFFETTRTGEVLSRLTTDTTLLQVVIGSSISCLLYTSPSPRD